MVKQSIARKATGLKKHKSPSASAKGISGSGGSQQKILDVAAALTKRLSLKEVPRKKVSQLSGVTATSTFANALTKLKREGAINFTGDCVMVTSQGMAMANSNCDDLSIPTTNRELQESIKEQFQLNPKSRMLMDALIDGLAHKKEDVATAIGCTLNSTFSNMLTKLKKLDILEFDRQTMKLTDGMFEVEGRPGC